MATKSFRSSGTQPNARGITQGNTLVDPKSGLPIAVIPDGSGTLRLAVDANLTADSIVVDTRDLSFTTDSVEVGDPVTGAHIRVETDGSINANTHTSAFSPSPDSELIVGTEDGTTTGTPHVVKVNPDGSLAVSIAVVSGTYRSLFNAITLVASGTPTTLQTYTVPPTKTGYLQKVNVSGTNIATYDIKINGVIQDRKRTYFGNSLNANFEYADTNEIGLAMSSGDILTIIVTHGRPSTGDFESRIQVVEV